MILPEVGWGKKLYSYISRGRAFLEDRSAKAWRQEWGSSVAGTQ